MTSDLVAVINNLGKSRPNIDSLNIKGLSDLETNLLLQIFTKADIHALDLVESNPSAFMKQLSEESHVSGMRWDDLVLNFEWMCELR